MSTASRTEHELGSVQPLEPVDRCRWRGVVLPVSAVGLWWLLSSLDIVNSALLVAPAKVLDTAVDQVTSGRLWRALGASLAREATGFLIGTLSGLVLGTLLGLSPLGLGDVAKVVFLSLAALVPVVVNTCDGIRTTPPGLLEVARVYGYTRRQTVAQVVLPAALPSIFTGVYLALIYSWLATIGAEYLLVAGRGIGNTLIEGSEHFQMDLVIFGMCVIGIVGWLMNASARALEARLARWRVDT
jgi:sulfonate transport system permease protein